MPIKTLYTTLGLEPDTTYDEIENTFVRLKLQYPKSRLDADENARIFFLAAQHAYQTFRDPDSRALYDQRISRAGIKTTTLVPGGDSSNTPTWLSTRNIVVTGVFLVLISSTWWYHTRQQARAEAETVQRLQKAEEEKLRKAALEAQEEARRQAMFESAQRQQEENRERQFQNEAQNAARQTDANLRSAQNQSEAKSRREQMDRDNRIRQEQAARLQSERGAETRLRNEKNELRLLCMQRYKRPDC